MDSVLNSNCVLFSVLSNGCYSKTLDQVAFISKIIKFHFVNINTL